MESYLCFILDEGRVITVRSTEVAFELDQDRNEKRLLVSLNQSSQVEEGGGAGRYGSLFSL
jgi:hypothetical protein